MKKIFSLVLSLLMLLTIPVSTPVVANAIETAPEFIVETTELQKPVLHNASSATSVLSQYIDLNEFKQILLESQQYSWDNNSPQITLTLDSSVKLPYNSQVFSALRTYVSDESGVIGAKVFSVSSVNSYITHIHIEYISKAEYDKTILRSE